MKNKLVVITISILIFISVLVLLLLGNKTVLKQSYGLSNSKDIAIMVWDNNSSSYKKSNNIPVGNYLLSNKSYCKNGGKIISYDNSIGKVYYNLSTADKCYLYFDTKNFIGEYVAALKSTTEKISSQDNSAYAVYTDLTSNNNIRYKGADPDNYVLFNGVLWRIVGSFNGSELGMDSNKWYAKIITDDSIGTYAWDSNSADAVWSASTLNAYLNGNFYNSITSKEMIVKANWFTGGPGEAYAPGDNVAEWYAAERTDNYRGFATAVDYSAFIGLSYPSDYGYALYDGGEYGMCSIESVPGYFSDCDSMSWMFKSISSRAWTLLDDLSNQNISYYASSSNSISNNITSNAYEVFPTLYLHNNVYITGGDGSKENPYTLDFDGVSTLSNTILGKVSTSNYTSSQDNESIYRVINKKETRYEGKDPDNYVKFNNQVWRIVGTFDGGIDLGKTSGEYYTKIVMGSSLGPLAWYTYRNNSWGISSLYTILNGDFYNGTGSYASTGITDGTSRSMIANVKWHLGSLSSSYTSKNSAALYDDERGNIGASGTTVAENLYKFGYFGLLYPSDYGYAAYSASCDNTASTTQSYPYNYETGCADVDWIYHASGKEAMWFITPERDSEIGAAATQSSGWLTNSQNVTTTKAILPTAYLVPNVKIVGGNGSAAYPYLLSL